MKTVIKLLILALIADCAIVIGLLVANKMAQPFIIVYWVLLLVKNTCDYFNGKGDRK